MSSSTSSSDGLDPFHTGDGGAASRWSILTALATLLLLSAVTAQLPMVPSYLTGSRNSLIKYASFREQVREAGPIEVVIIGASPVAGGVDPEALGEALASNLGRSTPVRAYNFGVGAHGVLTYPFTVGLIQGVARPELYVFVLTPFALNAEVRTWMDQVAMIHDSPYQKAVGDTVRLRGELRRWALDHWRLAALAPALRAWVVDGTAPESEYAAIYTPKGFHAFEDVESAPKLVEDVKRVLRIWRTTPEMFQALADAVARIRQKGGQVLIAEGPLRPDMRGAMTEPGRTHRDFQALMRRIGADYGVPVALLPVDTFDAENFAEHLHLNPESARANSRWLADQIAGRFGESLRE